MKRKPSKPKVTAKDVADFMVRRLDEEKDLYQEVIVHEIEQEFGSNFVYSNEHGNPAIKQSVLDEFRKKTPDIVWSQSERYWRRREPSDKPGSRRQE